MVSTNLKNICEIGSFPQVGINIKDVWNHHLVIFRGCIFLGVQIPSQQVFGCGTQLSHLPQGAKRLESCQLRMETLEFCQTKTWQEKKILRAGALRPIKSPKGTSTPWPQSFQGRHINIPKGTSIQRNPHGHGPMCWCRVNSYNTLKSILSYGKYVTKPT